MVGQSVRWDEVLSVLCARGRARVPNSDYFHSPNTQPSHQLHPQIDLTNPRSRSPVKMHNMAPTFTFQPSTTVMQISRQPHAA
ncbi:hypothetical protein BDV96DRAFT_580589 [Lophiotrema nucula]|uniref:Uncharacterized protein n=1 Tax=Lophiotrema nucula TaxID=690887 RepID=A0A6A5YZ17_9PLEO|nr:hypothetical protein BDV96DRAFT_580589 [Lophiotrema nucula]